ncbi:MAG: hypothetical protein LBG44_00780 [Gemmatimonadota bacterium]|jgi:hypothetical protein|nr:hypothetical protein [Gemmatimonadota bacterium]
MRRSLEVVGMVVMLGLAVSSPREVEGQSLLSTRGLGYPLQPMDARSMALGRITLGLPGAELSWANPASAVGIPAPGIVFGYQYDNYSADIADGVHDGHTARFPILLAAIPAGERLVFQVGLAPYLDQNWRILEQDTLHLTPDTVPILDWNQSNGGVNRLRFAVGGAVSRNVNLGLSLDMYTGSVSRILGRTFPGEVQPACCLAQWDYQGLSTTLGAHWSPTSDTGVGVSLGFGGTLTADPRDSVTMRHKVDMPLTLQTGASGRIAANVLALAGASWEGWSSLSEAMAGQGGARDTWSASAGIEWDGVSIRKTPLPFRAGYRAGTLPFSWSEDGSDFPNERAFTLGTGLRLAGGAVLPNFSLEIGNRTGGDFKESYWRFGASVRVMGQ